MIVAPDAIEGPSSFSTEKEKLIANILAYDNHVESAKQLKVRVHQNHEYTKTLLILFWAHLSSEVRGNSLISFCVILLTNQQTDLRPVEITVLTIVLSSLAAFCH